MQKQTPNILHEWSVLNAEDCNLIKLYVESVAGILYLFLLTKENHLGINDLTGYWTSTNIEQLRTLSPDEALKFYYGLERRHKEAC